MRLTRSRAVVGTIGGALIYFGSVSACTLKEAEPPPLVGPSELGLSLQIEAVPDTLAQDGVSQSRIIITARDASSRPIAGLELKVQTCISDPLGTICSDYGSLSQRSVVTGGNGRAELTYTAPEPFAAFVGSVSIVVTPVSSNAANALPRSVTIRLTPAGSVNAPPIPAFTFSPSSPLEGTVVQFDASTSRDPDGTIVSYDWSFGDGTTASGVRVTKTYLMAGTFHVTLTVTDDRGVAGQLTRAVAIGVSPAPTPKFTFSPTSPKLEDTVFFNASESTAASGRRLVGYDWDFGDGARASGVTASHRYGAARTYKVTLTVTDDIGKRASTSSDVSVGAVERPAAAFTFAPSSPRVGQTVFFDASASTAPPGSTIVEYRWDFGDSSSAQCPGSPGCSADARQVTKTFSAAGSYTVVLIVRDSEGRVGTTSQTVTVSP